MIKCLPQELKHVIGLAPQADGALTSDIVSLKNFNKAWIMVTMAQGHAAQHTTTLMQATDVAGGTNKAISENVPIWSNLDVSLADTLTERTAAKTYQLDVALKNKVVWFEVDPAACMDAAGGYDCLYVTSAGSNALNILAVDFFLAPKTKAAVLDAAITD